MSKEAGDSLLGSVAAMVSGSSAASDTAPSLFLKFLRDFGVWGWVT